MPLCQHSQHILLFVQVKAQQNAHYGLLCLPCTPASFRVNLMELRALRLGFHNLRCILRRPGNDLFEGSSSNYFSGDKLLIGALQLLFELGRDRHYLGLDMDDLFAQRVNYGERVPIKAQVQSNLHCHRHLALHFLVHTYTDDFAPIRLLIHFGSDTILGSSSFLRAARLNVHDYRVLLSDTSP